MPIDILQRMNSLWLRSLIDPSSSLSRAFSNSRNRLVESVGESFFFLISRFKNLITNEKELIIDLSKFKHRTYQNQSTLYPRTCINILYTYTLFRKCFIKIENRLRTPRLDRMIENNPRGKIAALKSALDCCSLP